MDKESNRRRLLSDLTISGFSTPRTDGSWGFHEQFLDTLRFYLEDPASFGNGGVVEATYTEGPEVDVFDLSNPDLADVDVFFVGWVLTNSYTTDEKNDMLQFVLNGGAMVATTDDLFHNMADVFGVTLSSGGSSFNTITNTEHPIADGCFGTVETYSQFANRGSYSDLGPAIEIGTNGNGPSLAVIEPNVLGPGSGPVVLAADVDIFSNAFQGSVVNEILINNIFGYLTGLCGGDFLPCCLEPCNPLTFQAAEGSLVCQHDNNVNGDGSCFEALPSNGFCEFAGTSPCRAIPHPPPEVDCSAVCADNSPHVGVMALQPTCQHNVVGNNNCYEPDEFGLCNAGTTSCFAIEATVPPPPPDTFGECVPCWGGFSYPPGTFLCQRADTQCHEYTGSCPHYAPACLVPAP